MRVFREKKLKITSAVSAVAILIAVNSAVGTERSPVAAGLSVGTGFPWVLHIKPELLIRPQKANPSMSFFVELNSAILASEATYGLSLNLENSSGHFHSFYIGSGDVFTSNFGEEGEEERRKQFMIGWEMKKEYGYNFGYFLNAGFDLILDPERAYPKMNIGFFFMPGF